MNNKSPVIILNVSKSFGEVDWILPVLKAFKERHPGWRIISLFGHRLIYDFLKLNTALYAEFRTLSELNIVPQEIGSLFRDEIEPEQVRIILKDYNEDQYCPYKNELERHCPAALVVSYPHSNHIFSNRDTDALRHCADPDAYSLHDLFLLGSEHDIPYWSAYVDTAKIRTFGYPRYDSWWMNRLLSAPEVTGSEEARRAKQAGKVFFYISRGAHSVYLAQQDYEYLLRSTMEETLRYPDALLLIKAHPRQDMDDLKRLLDDYDPKRWLVSGLHLMQLASLADVVISGWSSGILDALAVGKPVIEFWRFSGKDPDCRMGMDGRPSTIYRELGLAAPAETREELAALLAEALRNPGGPVWQAQRQAFRKYCKQTDTAAEAIAACLVDEMVRKQARLTQPPVGQPAPELVEGMVDFITELAEDGQDDRVKEWLDFLAAQFPENHRGLGNLGVFLFNQGDFSAAVEYLTASLKCDPTAQESAVNLVHILLLLGKVDEAARVVLSFYQNAVGSGPRAAFLQALREQAGEEQFILLLEGLSCQQNTDQFV